MAAAGDEFAIIGEGCGVKTVLVIVSPALVTAATDGVSSGFVGLQNFDFLVC